MFLFSLAGAVQLVIHSTLLSDRAVDHLINAGLFTGPLSLFHWSNRQTIRRTDRERQRQVLALEERFDEQSKVDTKIREHLIAKFEERDEEGRAMVLSAQARIAELAAEVRELTILVKNGLHEDVRDIKAELAKIRERELSRAEQRRQA